MKIINVVGARPNFVKISPILKAMKKYKSIKPILLHTGQHYDYNMSASFFEALNIPKPDINLGVGSTSHAQQTAIIMQKFEKVLLRKNPNLVLVLGDVNSTLACALTACKLHIKIAHVEAGMRSYDKRMPEEINRILTDQLSDYLFTTYKSDNLNLIKEGIAKNKIFLVGNVMADTLLNSVKLLSKKNIKKITPFDKYAVLTLHRQENVDNKQILKKLLISISDISDKLPIIFPVHPRTRKQIKKFNLNKHIKNNFKLIEPLGYLDFLNLYYNSSFVMTDSGGLQAETSILNIPCITLRENTEWTITTSIGTNILVGSNKNKIIKSVNKILRNKIKMKKKIPYWGGNASERIVKILLKKLH